MGWTCFVAPVGGSKEVPADAQKALDGFLRSLPTFVGWNKGNSEYRFIDVRWYASMRFGADGLKVYWDDYTPEWTEDLFALFNFAWAAGLTVYKDTGEEFSRRFVMRMLGKGELAPPENSSAHEIP